MTTAVQSRPFEPHAPTAALPARRWTGWHTGLVILAAGAALLTVWSVWTGSRSEYYAAIALSMSKSWPNFFFGAMDPAGTVTLDKIPGSFWIPALFVRIFGFSTWAVVLPDALAAVGAALIVAVTAKRLLNPTAGLLAGAIVATTPILVAVSRSNQPETFFVLGLSAVAWASAKALTRRSFGWLLVAGAFIALSFQTYMLEAWAVWPALAAAWLFTRAPWRRKLWQLALAGMVSLAASVSWIVIVSLIPAGRRPYIGSTLSDNPWEMVFGYNGLGRFGEATADASAYRSFTPPFSGDPGVFRLFNEQLAGQIAWLLPTAALAVVVLWILRFSRPATVLLGVWLATFIAMFSAVAGMHQFYTAALAIPSSLAIGLAFAAARRRGVAWAQVSLVAMAAVTAVGISLIYGGYSIPVALAQLVLAAIVVWLIVRERFRGGTPRAVVAVLAGAAMVLTPLAWSIVAIGSPSSTNPVAGGVSDVGMRGISSAAGGGPGMLGGPGAQAGAGGFPGGAGGAGGQGGFPGQGTGGMPNAPRGGSQGVSPGQAGVSPGQAGVAGGPGVSGGNGDSDLIAYLEDHSNGGTYLAATFGAQSAASLIIASDGGSFLPVGGFNGRDAVPTLERFQQLVASGDVRYVLTSGGFGSPFGAGGETGTSSDILSWVQEHCTKPADAPTTSLYECTALSEGQ
ncbi:glycosyltransferase family 39 protein [Microbacterium sp. F51-2R]|uniref:glycosyltransferase family 39 protein n=1 Tax=Microbacterium sp. F51-2R TaxID=3445777 RepID=UPI003F9FC1D8